LGPIPNPQSPIPSSELRLVKGNIKNKASITIFYNFKVLIKMKKKENSSFTTTKFASLKNGINSELKKPYQQPESKPDIIKVKPKTAFSAYKVLYDKLKTGQPTTRITSSKNTTRTNFNIHSLKALYSDNKTTFRESFIDTKRLNKSPIVNKNKIITASPHRRHNSVHNSCI
jgi:hypothetical protein